MSEEDIWKTEKRIVSSVKNTVERIVYPLVEFFKKHSLATGIVLAIIGMPFLALRQAPFLRDVKGYWDYETRTWVAGLYYGVIRSQLLLIGILFLVIGLILIIWQQRVKGKKR